MDIDDLIKNLAPFGFVILWVFSAIFSKKEEVVLPANPFSKRTPPPNPFVTNDLDSAKVAPAKVTQLDWSDLATPPSPKPLNSAQPIRKVARNPAYKKNQPARSSQSDNLSAQTKTTQVIPDMPPDKLGVPQMQLLHLVEDHAAEVHLNRPLATPQPAGSQLRSQNSLEMQELIGRLKRPNAMREAMILSVILDEPKCKKMLHQG